MQKAMPLSLLQTVLSPGTETARRSEHWSFAFVCGGFGYLLQGDQSKPLSREELILIPAEATVRLRASQLSTLALCHFELCPAEVLGLFTVLEERSLAQAAQGGRMAVRVLPAESPLARQFAALCGLREREPALILRGEMLRLAAHALRDSVRAPRPAGAASVEDRVRKLLSGAAAADLMSQPTCELARRCACSERHFRRLFKAEVGCPLRTWQTQGRIRKAARLLRESDAKVVDVALECGFQHLGQFNAAFKQLLGQTPSRWRRSYPRRSRPVVCPRSTEAAGRAVPVRWQDLHAGQDAAVAF